ncbi:hypothetical protein NBRC116188_19910 [Oceaniserpentilla sp. 4NH20-0058]|uniref:hypothetical protein n=1 Tax=Oceaniserpentilla sp. 4NH20-0058 TaxID=3127660 RepID=UPI003102528D
MTALACVLLIFSGLTLMVVYAVGPFANDPWLAIHVRFKTLSAVTQVSLKYSALSVSIVCSLQIIGVFPWLK